ncbi:extracellular solute-binding protein [Faecalibacterium sp. An58]|uniref:ABC transporter substrate-binding protein n=1 Tax=Faecalibacterium sp. An58 TaxID=1965648 RepID=UPI0013022F5E|nr:extracellular solute-binding protein [Faecalibacterium sp. An58]
MFAKRLRRLALTAAVCLCLAGCQAPSAGGQPAGASSASARPDEPVTLSVYLPKQYADPTTHYPIYEKLMDYQQAHPDIELTFVTPASNDLAEREAMISQLNAEILSGGGPDLFIMEGYRTTEINLFPDIEKAMVNGTFLDLTEAMAKEGLSREEDFYTAVLDAGQWEGRQYILPLGFSVPLMVSAADVLNASSFDLQRAMHTMDTLLTELLRIHQEQSILVIASFDALGALAQPVLDHEAHEVRLDTAAARRALELEKVFRTGDIAYDLARGLFDNTNPAQVQDEFAEGVPFAVLQDSRFCINLLRQCQALGIEVSVMPIPNEEGTVTAEIGSHAMGNRNTKYPEEVADLLLYLVSEECQSAAAYADYNQLPIRKGCMQACFDAQYQFSIYDASRERMTEEGIAERQEQYGVPLDEARIKQLEVICDQVTAAHYQTIWYRGVDLGKTETGENVASYLHMQYWNDEITLDELVETLSSKMRLYLDE